MEVGESLFDLLYGIVRYDESVGECEGIGLREIIALKHRFEDGVKEVVVLYLPLGVEQLNEGLERLFLKAILLCGVVQLCLQGVSMTGAESLPSGYTAGLFFRGREIAVGTALLQNKSFVQERIDDSLCREGFLGCG